MLSLLGEIHRVGIIRLQQNTMPCNIMIIMELAY